MDAVVAGATLVNRTRFWWGCMVVARLGQAFGRHGPTNVLVGGFAKQLGWVGVGRPRATQIMTEGHASRMGGECINIRKKHNMSTLFRATLFYLSGHGLECYLNWPLLVRHSFESPYTVFLLLVLTM